VVHVTTACQNTAPGIDAAVAGISRATAAVDGVSIALLGVLSPEVEWPSERDGSVGYRRVGVVGPRMLAYAPNLATVLSGLRPDVVHQHGAWQYPGVAASRWCHRSGRPFILSPHGMFSSAGLAAHRFRKAAAWHGWQRNVATTAHLLHATSHEEMLAIRKLGLRNPVAVIPLGVHVPPACPIKSSAAAFRAVYLGRLDPLKGVGDLVAAWAAVRPAGWTLTIAGPDLRGYGIELRRSVAAHRLEDVVSICGPAWAEDRDALLAAADLLVLPSYTENFGLVVAEAMAHAVPVITTTDTPWRYLQEEGCGWIVPSGLAGLVPALTAACGSDPQALREMGRRGWGVVRDRFGWHAIGRQFAVAYQWLCGTETRPSFVHLRTDS
jgi:glycosyltransferase involved in cell wall biosynthesis